MLNKLFDRKFSQKQFSTLAFFHKNAFCGEIFAKNCFLGGSNPHLKKKQRANVVEFLVSSFGHHSTPLSAIRPLPARFALFSLKSV